MPLANIGSVMQTGILSHNECKKLVHASVALESVQTRKALVSVPNGLRLHDYANVYFDCRNPMMSKIRGRADDICVLVINSDILNIKDVVVTDRNAASSVAFFGNPSEQIIVFA